MPSRKRGGKQRGPRGGIKHQPGRGHDSSSGHERKRRFAREAAVNRQQLQANAVEQRRQWDELTDEQK